MPLGAASGHYVAGVEILNEMRALPGYLLQSNSEYRKDYLGSESVGSIFTDERGKTQPTC